MSSSQPLVSLTGRINIWIVFLIPEPNARKAASRGQRPHRIARGDREEVQAVGEGVGAKG